MPRFRKVTFGRQKSQLLRPKKSESERRKRLKVWKKRLVKLGMTEAKVSKLTHLEARTLLKRPKKIHA
jgi:hypothetical protein